MLVIRIMEAENVLFVESGILGFEIRNSTQGMRNPVPGIQNSKGGTVLEDITWDQPCQVCSFAWFNDSMSKPQINYFCTKALYL